MDALYVLLLQVGSVAYIFSNSCIRNAMDIRSTVGSRKLQTWTVPDRFYGSDDLQIRQIKLVFVSRVAELVF